MNYRIAASILLIILFHGCSVSISAQTPIELSNRIEDILTDQESDYPGENLTEHYSELLENPIRLNASNQETLESALLFTPFQIYQILDYRERYGAYLSIYELASIPGFREDRLKTISPFISVAPAPIIHNKSGVSYFLMTDLKFIRPVSEGYKVDSLSLKSPYQGSPFQLSLRIKADINQKIFLGLTYRKDHGETLLLNKRPQFLSGYIEIRMQKYIKQILIGSFKLNAGLGLIAGTGFNQSLSAFSQQSVRPVLVKPYASVTEYDYLSGIVVHTRIKHLETIAWLSHNRQDLSLFRYTPAAQPRDWGSYFRDGGIHRTETEYKGAGLAFRQSAGLILQRKSKHLVLGATVAFERNGLSRTGLDSLGIPGSNSPLLPHTGVSFLWFNRQTEVFLETALSSKGGMAIMGGMKQSFNDFLNAMVLFRSYSENYSGIHASAYASGSKLQNECGPGLHINIYPFRRFSMAFALDYSIYPWLKYQLNAPSSAHLTDLEFKYQARIATYYLRISSKHSKKNISSGLSGIDLIGKQSRDRIRIQVSTHLSPRVDWNARLDVSQLEIEGEKMKAYLMYQELSCRIEDKLTLKGRYILFNIPNWENRIYCYEPGLRYSYNFPAFYGNGSRIIGILQLNPLRRLRIGIKGMITLYNNQAPIGAGNDLVHGNKKWGLEFQIILKN